MITTVMQPSDSKSTESLHCLFAFLHVVNIEVLHAILAFFNHSVNSTLDLVESRVINAYRIKEGMQSA